MPKACTLDAPSSVIFSRERILQVHLILLPESSRTPINPTLHHLPKNASFKPLSGIHYQVFLSSFGKSNKLSGHGMFFMTYIYLLSNSNLLLTKICFHCSSNLFFYLLELSVIYIAIIAFNLQIGEPCGFCGLGNLFLRYYL